MRPRQLYMGSSAEHRAQLRLKGHIKMAMEIVPDAFDLVVVGTGLQEALLASAAALCGKSVLHIDRGSYYGDLWAGLNMDECRNHLSPSVEAGEAETVSDCHVVRHWPCAYENVETVQTPEAERLSKPQDYILELAPKVTYQAGPLIKGLMQTQAHNYVDYRLVEATYVMREGELIQIPASRSDIFKDRVLTPLQKRALTAFLKNAVELLETRDPTKVSGFDEWLSQHGLDEKVLQMVKTGVCCSESSEDSLSRFEALGYYLQSAGRLKDGSGPFMVPYYSASDVPQAFCRLCAVHGGVYVLNCGLQAVKLPQENQQMQILTQHGQWIQCAQLALPTYYLPFMPSLQAELPEGIELSQRRFSHLISVLDRSLNPPKHQIMIRVPRYGQSPMTFLQVTSPSCPAGQYVVYGYCEAVGVSAREDLAESFRKLLSPTEEPIPQILFELYYHRLSTALPTAALPHISFLSGPEGVIGHLKEFQSAQSHFKWLFPGESFLQPPIIPSLGESDDERYAEFESAFSHLTHPE